MWELEILGEILRKLKKTTTHEFTRVVAGLVCPHGTDQCRLGGARPRPPPSRHGRRGGAATPEPTRGRFDAGRGCADARKRANSGRAALTHTDVLTRTGVRQHGGMLTQARPGRRGPRGDAARPGPTCAGRVEPGGAVLTRIVCAHTESVPHAHPLVGQRPSRGKLEGMGWGRGAGLLPGSWEGSITTAQCECEGALGD